MSNGIFPIKVLKSRKSPAAAMNLAFDGQKDIAETYYPAPHPNGTHQGIFLFLK